MAELSPPTNIENPVRTALRRLRLQVRRPGPAPQEYFGR